VRRVDEEVALYAVTIDVPEPWPIELYDSYVVEVLERTGGVVDGLLVQFARRTGAGFQVVEVWASHGDFERYGREVAEPVAAQVLQGRPHPPEEVTEFEVRGLVLPRAGVAV
jgi:hypothetical protein